MSYLEGSDELTADEDESEVCHDKSSYPYERSRSGADIALMYLESDDELYVDEIEGNEDESTSTSSSSDSECSLLSTTADGGPWHVNNFDISRLQQTNSQFQ